MPTVQNYLLFISDARIAISSDRLFYMAGKYNLWQLGWIASFLPS